MNDKPAGPDLAPWYRAVTGYQWLVLALASAGWIFDVYEGQIFNLTSEPLLKDILAGQASKERIDFYRDFFLGIFLAGGALGGILFGSLADRWGRRPVMIVTILFYSIFSGLTYFASSLWEIGALRFLVAMGVGGEWSVAAALVAEIFPARAGRTRRRSFTPAACLERGLPLGPRWLSGTPGATSISSACFPPCSSWRCRSGSRSRSRPSRAKRKCEAASGNCSPIRFGGSALFSECCWRRSAWRCSGP